jgi:hypothetical protein
MPTDLLSANRLLARLPPHDLARLRPSLQTEASCAPGAGCDGADTGGAFWGKTFAIVPSGE